LGNQINIYIKPHSVVDWQLDDIVPSERSACMYIHFFVAEHSTLQIFLGMWFEPDLELEIFLHMQGAQSNATVFGCYALDQQQNYRVKTYQLHELGGGQSQVIIRGLVKDQARASIHSLIYIAPDAAHTSAAQENKNIILGNQAHVISIPSIEVLNAHVQCSHATASSTFDQMQAWYLYSKGVQKDQVHQLLIQSFLQPVLKKCKNFEQDMEMICQKMAKPSQT
jgi:Fe-S cluster assembly scaffold protein SufB